MTPDWTLKARTFAVADVTGTVGSFYTFAHFLLYLGFAHNAENISATVRGLFDQWNISDKIIFCTTDTTSTFPYCIQILQLAIRCDARISSRNRGVLDTMCRSCYQHCSLLVRQVIRDHSGMYVVSIYT